VFHHPRRDALYSPQVIKAFVFAHAFPSFRVERYGKFWYYLPKRGCFSLKLNYDCVRDAMLFLEAEPYIKVDKAGNPCFDSVAFSAFVDALPQYRSEDIFYALFNLAQAGYIDVSEFDAEDVVYDFYVNYITHNGHEFLESIKPPTVWDKTKAITAKAGAISLGLIRDVAADVLVRLASGQVS
jgi:hypothetical protein